MPGYDGTGPQGRGPMTGRGMGVCETGQPRPRSLFRGFFGGRGGGGRGRRNMYYATGLPGWVRYEDQPAQTKEQEKEYLQEEVKVLEKQLNSIKERLKEIGD